MLEDEAVISATYKHSHEAWCSVDIRVVVGPAENQRQRVSGIAEPARGSGPAALSDHDIDDLAYRSDTALQSAKSRIKCVK